MRDLPGGIHTVTEEPATQLVVQATPGHLLQGMECLVGGCPPALLQQQLQLCRHGKLRCTTKAAVAGIKVLCTGGQCLVQGLQMQFPGRGDRHRIQTPAGTGHRLGLPQQFSAMQAVQPTDVPQYILEGRHAKA